MRSCSIFLGTKHGFRWNCFVSVWLVFLPFEALAASAIFELYKPSIVENKTRTLKMALLVGAIGAIIFSPFVPKEEGSKIIDWIGSAFAGASSLLFAFVCIHLIKMKNIKKMDESEYSILTD